MKKPKRTFYVDSLIDVIRNEFDHGALREAVREILGIDVSHVGFIDDEILITLADGESFILSLRRQK